jgi:hypothetical protein
VIFTIDIVLDFNTGFYEEGVLITDRQQISINYFKNDFLINLISTAGLFTQILFEDLTYLNFVFLLRLKQMTNLIAIIEEHFKIK